MGTMSTCSCHCGGHLTSLCGIDTGVLQNIKPSSAASLGNIAPPFQIEMDLTASTGAVSFLERGMVGMVQFRAFQEICYEAVFSGVHCCSS